jgi:hypothetical protein
MANEFIFPNAISEKIERAIKNTAIKLGKATVLSVRDELNTRSTDDIEFDFSNPYYDGNVTRDPDRTGSFLAGTDRLVNVTFKATPFLTQDGVNTTTPELSLEICTLGVATINRVVKTNIMNQRGSVKEIVGQNDYAITISGVLVGDFGIPTTSDIQNGKPIEQMRKLIEICDAKVAVEVASDYLNNFGVDRIVIERVSFPQSLDSTNTQQFSITCSSDDPNLTIL